MSENLPSPSDKSQAEGDRETVDQEVDDATGAGLPSGVTVEQEIAESD